MRLYFIGSLYISQLQHGIQGLHSFGEMALKYLLQDEPPTAEQRKVLRDFLTDHGTAIFLRGGDVKELDKAHRSLAQISEDWPANSPVGELLFSKFHEPAMGGMLTSVTAIVPECSYFDGRQPGRHQARLDLMDKVKAAGYEGYEDLLEASFDAGAFTPEERLALVFLGFSLVPS